MTELIIVATDNAPKAVGPYSQAIRAGQFVYTAGQVGFAPGTTDLVGPTIEEQTHQTFKNLANILEAAGTDLQHVVKATVFMVDLGEFAQMNAIYAEHFGSHKPARSTFQVVALPKGARVEIECVAVIP